MYMVDIKVNLHANSNATTADSEKTEKKIFRLEYVTKMIQFIVMGNLYYSHVKVFKFLCAYSVVTL